MRSLIRMFAVVAFLGSTAAAQLFVVDAAGGAGVQFSSLSLATRTVPDGSTLVVRAGVYQPFRIAAKGLRVLADPGVVVDGSIVVKDTSAAQEVLLAGMTFSMVTPGANSVVLVENCAGLVSLVAVTTPPSIDGVQIIPGFVYYPTALTITGCAQVAVRDATLSRALVLDSRAVFESCNLRGEPAVIAPPTEGMFLGDSEVDIVGESSITGGAAPPGSTAGAGIVSSTSSLSIRGGTVAHGAGNPTFAVFMLSGNASIDPAVTVVGLLSPMVGTVVFEELAQVTSRGAPPGGVMSAGVQAEPGDLVALFAGVPGDPVSLPGLPGTTWLDPAGIALQVLAVQVAASTDVTAAIPSVAALRGLPVAWQALTLGANGLRSSNPSLAFVE